VRAISSDRHDQAQRLGAGVTPKHRTQIRERIAAPSRPNQCVLTGADRRMTALFHLAWTACSLTPVSGRFPPTQATQNLGGVRPSLP
jgi:hypothetical protein